MARKVSFPRVPLAGALMLDRNWGVAFSFDSELVNLQMLRKSSCRQQMFTICETRFSSGRMSASLD
jgi:hypothetical protein